MSKNVLAPAPIEIWDYVATQLTVDGIEALGLVSLSRCSLIRSHGHFRDNILVVPSCRQWLVSRVFVG
jgi:hypothetical protein